MIFLGGLSGSGKSHLAHALTQKHRQFAHFKASAILRNLNLPLDQLTRYEATKNQRALVDWLQRLPDSAKEVSILDGHGILLVREGIFEVPLRFFEAINPCLIATLEADPKQILIRRTWPEEFGTPEALSKLQDQEIAHLSSVAAQLGIPMLKVRSTDRSELEDFLVQSVRRAARE